MSDADDLSLMRSPPRNWTLRLWGTVLQKDGRQTPHIHPLGWMSGVYYAKVPKDIVGDPGENGWLEFGPPPTQICIYRAAPYTLDRTGTWQIGFVSVLFFIIQQKRFSRMTRG